jgi:hypothetical protein
VGVHADSHRFDEPFVDHGLRLQHAGGLIHSIVLSLPLAPVRAREPLPGAVASRRSRQRLRCCCCCCCCWVRRIRDHCSEQEPAAEGGGNHRVGSALRARTARVLEYYGARAY